MYELTVGELRTRIANRAIEYKDIKPGTILWAAYIAEKMLVNAYEGKANSYRLPDVPIRLNMEKAIRDAFKAGRDSILNELNDIVDSG